MNCIHGIGSSVVDYVILDIPVYNQIVNFDLLNDHDPTFDHKPLTLTLNFIMHQNPIEENSNNQRNLFFDKKKLYLFLRDLNTKLNILSYKNNIEDLYHNFMTTLSTSIKQLSIKVLRKRKNRISNPSYDNECKLARKTIRYAYNKSLKYNKINRYKALIKRKKRTT
jgi:hypothetical protein